MRRLVIVTFAWAGGITVAWVGAVWVWLVVGRWRERNLDPDYDRQPYD
jgi:hypothetical protein